MTALQNFVNEYGLGISKENLISKAYRQLTMDGHTCCLLNEKYITIDGVNYQVIKNRKQGSWIVKAF